MKTTIIASLVLAAAAGTAFGTAIDIPMSAKQGPALMNGDGLNGKGWNVSSTDLPWLRKQVGYTSNWTFMDRNVHSPNNASGVTGTWPGTVVDFLGTDASMYTGAANQMAKGVTMQWKGFISIKEAGMFTMGAYGNGLFEVKLGGTTILNKSGDTTGGDTQAIWLNMAGMYAIEVNYSNPTNAAGITLLWSKAGDGKLSGANVPANINALNIIPTASFFKAAIPAPGAAALLGLGGLVAARRRR